MYIHQRQNVCRALKKAQSESEEEELLLADEEDLDPELELFDFDEAELEPLRVLDSLSELDSAEDPLLPDSSSLFLPLASFISSSDDSSVSRNLVG